MRRPTLSILTKLSRTIGKLSHWPVVTQRGVILLVFCCYLILGPIPTSSDIVAAALAWGTVTLIILVSCVTAIHARIVKHSLNLSWHPPPDDDAQSRSQQPIRCIIKLSKTRLIPGIVLELKPICRRAGINIPTIQIVKGSYDQQPIALDIIAPHRGVWEISSISCCMRDSFGLSHLYWSIALESSIKVAPQPSYDSPLPLISSTQRPGDLLTDAVHRFGDPYDVKAYHPSDGIRKIIWKSFAKSGELLSRHPEASMTPEGFVALLVLARPEDDSICAKAEAYVRSLKELKLDIALGCEGQNGRSFGYDTKGCHDLLIDTTWDSLDSDIRSIIGDTQALLDSLLRAGIGVTIRRLGIFCSSSRLATTSGYQIVNHLALWLNERLIEPVFLIDELEEKNRNAQYNEFIKLCLANSWEVYVA
jgi:hypothetical protein